MIKFTLVLVFLSVFITTFTINARSEGIKEGNWSITTTTKVGGMSPQTANAMNAMDNMSPEMKEIMKQHMPANIDVQSLNPQAMTITVTQCISNQIPFPIKSAECQQTHKIDGNTVHFNETCTSSSGSLEGNGYVTYNGDSMEGDMKAQLNLMNQPMQETSHITGKYIGPCS